jgi:hypothetical protein
MDAITEKVMEAKHRGIPNVYDALITDVDNKDTIFHITNNVQSSSILELGTHLQEHPNIMYVQDINKKSMTIDTFFKKHDINPENHNFWNIDIQGAELMALHGASKSLPSAKALYLEVNQNELYKNCALLHDIDEFLSQYHFKRVLTYMTVHGWGDALYIIE